MVLRKTSGIMFSVLWLSAECQVAFEAIVYGVTGRRMSLESHGEVVECHGFDDGGNGVSHTTKLDSREERGFSRCFFSSVIDQAHGRYLQSTSA